MPVTQLPPSVQRILDQAGSGYFANPQQSSNAGQTVASLQAAAAQRFGNGGQFDSQYDQGIRGLLGEVPGLEANYQNQQGRLDENFSLGADKMARDDVVNQEHNTNQMADHGLGYSGANLVGQGRIQEGFQRGIQGLVTNRARGLSDLTGAQNAAYRQIESRAGDLQGQAAGRATARDEQKAWQDEQIRMQTEQAKLQQDQANAALAFQQQAQAANEAAQRRMEQQLTMQSQPRIDSGGSYQAAQAPPSPLVSGLLAGMATGAVDPNVPYPTRFGRPS